VSASSTCKPVNAFSATLNWMDEQVLTAGRSYLLQHNVNLVKAKVMALQNVLDIHSMEQNPKATQFQLNDIGKVLIKTAKPLFADTYQSNPANGSFILIDEFSNHTVAVGFIENF